MYFQQTHPDVQTTTRLVVSLSTWRPEGFSASLLTPSGGGLALLGMGRELTVCVPLSPVLFTITLRGRSSMTSH